MDIEELTSISTVTIIYKGSVLKVLLDIPSLGRANYLAYRIHPLPVLQTILGNNSVKTYILPKFSHIAIEESQRTYFLMNHRDVAACTELTGYKICEGNLSSMRMENSEVAKRIFCSIHRYPPYKFVTFKRHMSTSLIVV